MPIPILVLSDDEEDTRERPPPEIITLEDSDDDDDDDDIIYDGTSRWDAVSGVLVPVEETSDVPNGNQSKESTDDEKPEDDSAGDQKNGCDCETAKDGRNVEKMTDDAKGVECKEFENGEQGNDNEEFAGESGDGEPDTKRCRH